MTLKEYIEKKTQQAQFQWNHRKICWTCRQPDFSCYCDLIKPVDVQMKFVILIHPIEVKRRIASGRMAHLCLKDSHLIEGQDFTKNVEVNTLLEDRSFHPLVLYPGVHSNNLSKMKASEISSLVPNNKKLLIFVIDGTWNTARKMIRLSHNLNSLPRVCFDPKKPSNFRLRKQPRPGCVSTIEAIYECIEYFETAQSQKNQDHFLGDSRPHNHLIEVFTKMIDRQVELIGNIKRINSHL